MHMTYFSMEGNPTMGMDLQKGFRFRGFMIFMLTWCVLFSLYAAAIGRYDLVLPTFYVGLPLGVAAALLLRYSGFISWMKKRSITGLIPYYILVFSILFMVFRGQYMLALPLVLVLFLVIVMHLRGLIRDEGVILPPQAR